MSLGVLLSLLEGFSHTFCHIKRVSPNHPNHSSSSSLGTVGLKLKISRFRCCLLHYSKDLWEPGDGLNEPYGSLPLGYSMVLWVLQEHRAERIEPQELTWALSLLNMKNLSVLWWKRKKKQLLWAHGSLHCIRARGSGLPGAKIVKSSFPQLLSASHAPC